MDVLARLVAAALLTGLAAGAACGCGVGPRPASLSTHASGAGEDPSESPTAIAGPATPGRDTPGGTQPSTDLQCHAAAYALASDGRLVLTPSRGGGGRAAGLRSLFMETGAQGRVVSDESGFWIESPTPSGRIERLEVEFGSCESGEPLVRPPGAGRESARRMHFAMTPTTFVSAGTTLRGALILPESGDATRVVVQVHGSERTSALDCGRWRQIWPALGVAVFVYDKRGTGGSEGTYTQDFHVLAADAAAAVNHVRAILGTDAGVVVLYGTSQGGWIAPLAATLTRVDFVIVGYGLAHSPLVEDREQVLQELRAAGYDEDALAQAVEVTDATALGVSTGFVSGLPQIAAVRARFGDEPWFREIEGEYSGDVLSTPPDRLAAMFRDVDVGTTWDYDPLPALRSIRAPMLWVLAGDDHEAPSALTIEILSGMRAELPTLGLVVFPTADHEIQEYAAVDGARIEIGYSHGYLDLLGRWVRSRTLSLDGTNAELR